MLVSIITPFYNEELVAAEFHKRVTAVADGLPRHSFEFVFVNDGSTAGTLELLKGLRKKDRRVRVIDLSRNFGHQAALFAGIRNASGDAAVIIDGDLQDPPELIPALIENWEDGYDIVYARRVKRKGEPALKKLTARLYYRLLNFLSDTGVPHDVGDFRLIDRKVLAVLREMKEANLFLRGIIPWMGFSQTAVEYDRDARYAGDTKYSLIKMINLALDGITSFSTKPLRLSLQVGFVSILIGLGLILYAVIVKIVDPTVLIRGWPSLLITVVFFGGVQLFTIGILGEYVAKIYRETKSRPIYIIRSMMGFDERSDGRSTEDAGRRTRNIQ